jgi:hypothetical protein
MNNPPAFPHVADILQFDGNSVTVKSLTQNGMSLRDYMAAKAMQGYCADTDYKKDCGQEDTAISAYAMADAMLKARES